jgi:CubicO group peptidase (beta-lactamase class C family)
MTAETVPPAISPLDEDFHTIVEEARNRYHVPGIAVGILRSGAFQVGGSGVTSVEYPLPVTEHTMFQIGSTTKTVTGTVIMQLVEEGRIELEAPVRAYLPDLRLSDERVAATVTIRHLLQHSSGWVGDFFTDTGRGDEALRKVAEEMATLAQVTPLGEIYSYNNSGFYLAGAVIEAVTGRQYETVVRERVFEPLGMTESFFFPEEVMTRSFAVGHTIRDETAEVARPWELTRCANPAGGIAASAIDNLKYARFHLGDGTAPDGTRILSPESIRAMQTPQFPAGFDDWVGLTWFIDDSHESRIVRHGGGTNGQVSAFQMVPERDFAIAVLTNGNQGKLLDDVVRWAMKQYAGVTETDPEPQSLPEERLAGYAGQYESFMTRLDLAPREGVLEVQIVPLRGFPTNDSPLPPAPPPFRVSLGERERVIGLDEGWEGLLGEFLRGPNGEITWLRSGGRLYRRIGDATAS